MNCPTEKQTKFSKVIMKRFI